MRIKNFKTFNKISSVLISGALAITLVGCTNEKPQESDENSVAISQNTETISEEVQPQEEKATMQQVSKEVEDELDRMVEEGLYLVTGTDKESVDNSKENIIFNYNNIIDFLFNGGNIMGYKKEDVSEATITKAKETAYQLDAIIESYIPEYKERAKQKLEDAGEWSKEKLHQAHEWLTSDETIEKMAEIYNKFEDYKNEFKETKDKVKEKARELRK